MLSTALFPDLKVEMLGNKAKQTFHPNKGDAYTEIPVYS